MLEIDTKKQYRCKDQAGSENAIFSPDSKQLLLQNGGPVRIWEIESGQISQIEAEDSYVAWSHDGLYLASFNMTKKCVEIWSIPNKVCVDRLHGCGNYVTCMHWNSKGLLATSSLDRAFKVWRQVMPTVKAPIQQQEPQQQQQQQVVQQKQPSQEAQTNEEPNKLDDKLAITVAGPTWSLRGGLSAGSRSRLVCTQSLLAGATRAKRTASHHQGRTS